MGKGGPLGLAGEGSYVEGAADGVLLAGAVDGALVVLGAARRAPPDFVGGVGLLHELVPTPRAQLVPARARLEPAVRRVQGGAAQRALLLLRERGRGRPTSRLVRRRSLSGNGIRGAVRFRSRSRRRRRRLRARGTRRRDVAHRGNRRKGHPTMSPRARRVATASTLPAAGPRTRRELSSSERARFTAVGRSERSGFRAAARLPSPRSRGPASQRLARSLARGSAHAARCLGRVAHRNPRPNCGRRARTTHRDGRERCDYNYGGIKLCKQ